MDDDKKCVKMAIDLAIKSYNKGVFPSGALLVCNEKIISEHLASSSLNAHHHSNSKCMDEAVEMLGKKLEGCPFILLWSLVLCVW
ncbi:hypothetical protein GF362_06050 [Candidatus Dojkabacteria bacterium]|nr:hypothetical protein [Candidatus Dojkabacteria bacterium]